ncbi:hypothetical protein N7493_010805 [Penicillium malachiteum]|uniref:Heterokaryon incompatibility domain-containing protein n=1 Tax=Penicillium malachiteum TaxID=1324776 RepID=A0AAD6HDH6_9EURO|nr:hypothetical protein N7493_010805 [Penicillium malachiteum]
MPRPSEIPTDDLTCPLPTKRDDQHPELRQSYTNDIDMLEEQCGNDFAWIVKELRRSSMSVEEEFQKYVRIQKLSENLRSAQQYEAEAKKDNDTAMQQERHANTILQEMDHPAISYWVNATNQLLEHATENRKLAYEEKEKFLLRTSIPNDNAMESLLKCLQRIRSLRKIKESISKARDIFDTRQFSKNSKRYIWLDTCCIDKSDAGELTKSLALMGEWYANADFCLVHLDTDVLNDDWMEEWKTYGIDFLQDDWMKCWKTCVNQSPAWTNKANASDFGDIEAASSMRWATRGWTLQELVLSKMLFFFNSQWGELGRTVDGLGPYYYLTPFLDHYLKNADLSWDFASSDLEQMWADLLMKFEKLSRGDFLETQIKQLVYLLQVAGFVVPRHLSVRTSESQIEYAIRACSVQDLRKDLKETFELEIPPETSFSDREIIIFILKKLRYVAREPIKTDRKDISRFSKIATLNNWTQGTSPTDNSAYNVLITSSARKTEVSTDKAYSLMGILNVRFPAFPAEGLPRALCRLLDEKIIVSNDISIFNWSGKYFGSTIQGRSLYPSCIEAYQDHAEVMSQPAVRDINKLVLDISEGDRPKKKEITHSTVNLLLGDMIKLVSPLDYDELDDELIESFIDFIRYIKQLPLDSLELDHVSDELGNIREKFMNLSKRYEQENTKTKQPLNDPEDVLVDLDEWQKNEVGSPHEEEESQRNTQSEDQHACDENASDKPNEYREEEVQTPVEDEKPQKKSRFGIRGMVPKLPIEISVPIKIKPPKLDLPRSISSKLKSEKTPETPKMPSEFEKIMANLKSDLQESVMNMGNMKKFPSETNSNDDPFAGPSISGLKPLPVGYSALQSKCHNPIVISSSGISGTFDIQRIAVTMLEPEYLRAQIKKSVAGQNIESWCTVSTGFAYILVNANCERDILEQQLDMTEVIEETFLKVSKTDSDTHDLPDEAASKSEPNSLNKTLSKAGDKRREGDDDFFAVETDEDPKQDKTDAQKRLENCIDMIQEQDLHAVAGEWVLARFSDVPAAEWFLCRLELGSGSEFYGRRIPTDCFTFANAIPEKGLIDYWEQLMTKRKEIACDAMLKYMKGKRIRRNTENFFKNKRGQDARNLGESEPQASTGSFTFIIQELAKGATRLGDYGLRRLADRMLENVDRISLENIPPKLQAAVMSLGSKEELKPAMVRSGINIHMF